MAEIRKGLERERSQVKGVVRVVDAGQRERETTAVGYVAQDGRCTENDKYVQREGGRGSRTWKNKRFQLSKCISAESKDGWLSTNCPKRRYPAKPVPAHALSSSSLSTTGEVRFTSIPQLQTARFKCENTGGVTINRWC